MMPRGRRLMQIKLLIQSIENSSKMINNFVKLYNEYWEEKNPDNKFPICPICGDVLYLNESEYNGNYTWFLRCDNTTCSYKCDKKNFEREYYD